MNSNLYLITGDETFEKQECLEKIKNDFGQLVKGINFITLEKDGINSLENEINTYPFGFEKKLIIVKFDKKEKSDSEQTSEKNEWLSESLEETLSKLDDVWVVFIRRFSKKKSIIQVGRKVWKMFCV